MCIRKVSHLRAFSKPMQAVVLASVRTALQRHIVAASYDYGGIGKRNDRAKARGRFQKREDACRCLLRKLYKIVEHRETFLACLLQTLRPVTAGLC